MKKITLITIFALAGIVCKANDLTVYNYTGCTYSISLIHGNFDIPPTPPGSPIVMSSATPNDIFIGKISYNDPVSFNLIFSMVVGIQPTYPGFATSGAVYSACSPSPVTAIWSQASSIADAFLTIF